MGDADPLGTAQLFNTLGGALISCDRPLDALRIADKALEFSRRCALESAEVIGAQATAFQLRGHFFSHLGRKTEAIDSIEKSVSLFERLGRTKNEVELLITLSCRRKGGRSLSTRQPLLLAKWRRGHVPYLWHLERRLRLRVLLIRAVYWRYKGT